MRAGQHQGAAEAHHSRARALRDEALRLQASQPLPRGLRFRDHARAWPCAARGACRRQVCTRTWRGGQAAQAPQAQGGRAACVGACLPARLCSPRCVRRNTNDMHVLAGAGPALSRRVRHCALARLHQAQRGGAHQGRLPALHARAQALHCCLHRPRAGLLLPRARRPRAAAVHPGGAPAHRGPEQPGHAVARPCAAQRPPRGGEKGLCRGPPARACQGAARAAARPRQGPGRRGAGARCRLRCAQPALLPHRENQQRCPLCSDCVWRCRDPCLPIAATPPCA